MSPDLARSVRSLYASIDVERSPIELGLVTLLVVLAEELTWRGLAIDVVASARSKLTIGAISVLLYVVPQLAGGEPLLIVAATLLGAVFAAQRLITGGLSAPFLTHAMWSLAVFVVFPLA